MELKPNDATAHCNLGSLLAGQGQFDEALAEFQQALSIDPYNGTTHCNLGNLLASRGQFEDALAHYRRAVKIQPAFPMARCKLAWLRATCPAASLRNGAEAIEQALQAERLAGAETPAVLDYLAAAYAEAAWFPEALATARKALQLATEQKDTAFANVLRTRIALYEAGKPFHQPPPPAASPRPKP